MVSGSYNFINVVPDATPFPVGFDPVWLNLDAADPVVADYLAIISNKSIVLIEEVDFDRDDWQTVYWLSKSGHRLDGPDLADAHVLHNSYLDWPGINVTVLGHGPAPPPPAPVVLSGDRILTFATKLASRHNEWDSYMKGLYIALDALGLRFVEDEGVYTPVRSNLSYSNICVPQPADYNFMFHIFRLYPKSSDVHKDEVLAWAVLRPTDRVRSAALYSCVLSSASTTALYGLNLTMDNLVEWGMGLQTPPFVNEVMSSILNTPSVQIKDNVVTMLRTPKKAFPLWMGCSVADNLYPGSFWCCSYGGQHNAALAMHDFAPLYTPQLFPPLVCDNWLHVHPIEWGISAPQPKANLKLEVRVGGVPECQGWYSSIGSRDYLNLVSSDCPIKLATYANLALNVILQFLDQPAQPLLSRQTGAWTPGMEGQWDAPQPIPAAQFGWIAELYSKPYSIFMS